MNFCLLPIRIDEVTPNPLLAFFPPPSQQQQQHSIGIPRGFATTWAALNAGQLVEQLFMSVKTKSWCKQKLQATHNNCLLRLLSLTYFLFKSNLYRLNFKEWNYLSNLFTPQVY